MTQPRNKTEDLLLSLTQNCETLIKQTHRKPKETMEFKLTKPRETFNFKPTVEVKEDWMLGLTSLEVYKSIFTIKEENNEFELYTDPFESDSSFDELKDKVAEVLGLSDITIKDLKHES